MKELLLSMSVGLLAGTASAMGLGGGTVLLIYLTLFASVDQLAAQGINLIFFIPTALAASFMSARQGLLDKGIILRGAAFGLVGVLLGNLLSSAVSADTVGRLFGGLLLFIGLKELFSRGRA